eukprot:6848014-Alexandrium_andersonii.AAC.1
MSASLVGSEMCIRDRSSAELGQRLAPTVLPLSAKWRSAFRCAPRERPSRRSECHLAQTWPRH